MPAEDMSAVAARWLRDNRETLFDADGRHLFTSSTTISYLLSALAQPYLIEPEHEWLGDKSLLRSGKAQVYREFYERLGIAERVPGDTCLFGISVPMGPQLVPALLLAETVKRERPDLRIVLGGPTLSLMAEGDLTTLLAIHRQVDAVVRFDGELPITSLFEQARTGSAWRPTMVPGTSARTGDATTHTPPGPGLHPNVLPYAEYDQKLLNRLAQVEIGITQARGCYWGKCDYCDFVELYDGSPPYRGRSVNSFVDELEYQVEKHGIRHFEFITESIPPAFARRMCQEIIARDLNIVWNSFAMVDRRFDAELLELMVRAGCEYLIIGMETTSTRVLKLVHKSADRDENIRFVRDARAAHLKLRVNLIPDLPSTTMTEAMESLRDVAEFADGVESFISFPFEATRSSNVGRHPERFGLVSADVRGIDHQAQYALNHLGNRDPAMSDEERRCVHRAFNDFVTQHNSRRSGEVDADLLKQVPGPDAPVRFRTEHLDLVWRDDKVVITNVLRLKRTVFPVQLASTLRPWLDGSAFTLRRLAELRGTAWAEQVMKQLIDVRMLAMTDEAGATPGFASNQND